MQTSVCRKCSISQRSSLITFHSNNCFLYTCNKSHLTSRGALFQFCSTLIMWCIIRMFFHLSFILCTFRLPFSPLCTCGRKITAFVSILFYIVFCLRFLIFNFFLQFYMISFIPIFRRFQCNRSILLTLHNAPPED